MEHRLHHLRCILITIVCIWTCDCGRAGPNPVGANLDFRNWARTAAMKAFGGLPLDSICQRGFVCSLAVLDSNVRLLPEVRLVDIYKLPVVTRLSTAEVKHLSIPGLTVRLGNAPTQAPTRDTLSVSLAVVNPGPDTSQATVMAVLMIPDYYGIIARVYLQKAASGWRVLSVKLQEA